MKRYWLALTVAMFFYAQMDILIWQRIFEANDLIELGVGVYHWGWFQSLIGFMILGILVCYPNFRRMVQFPLTLAILAFSGLEDILYYWLDGKHIPAELPWLSSNPLILQPVTREALFVSACFWVLFALALDLSGDFLEKRQKAVRHRNNQEAENVQGIGIS